MNEGQRRRGSAWPAGPPSPRSRSSPATCCSPSTSARALHVCHVSTAGSVEIVRWAKARGIYVTAEVTPHHLLLTDELAAELRPVYKVNPPLREAADVEALREALADGTIDIVATDHAPHAERGQGLRVGRRPPRHARPADRAVGGRRRRWCGPGLLDWRGVAG